MMKSAVKNDILALDWMLKKDLMLMGLCVTYVCIDR